MNKYMIKIMALSLAGFLSLSSFGANATEASVSNKPESTTPTPKENQKDTSEGTSEIRHTCIITCSKTPQRRVFDLQFDYDKTKMTPESQKALEDFRKSDSELSTSINYQNVTKIEISGVVDPKSRNQREKRELKQRLDATERLLVMYGYNHSVMEKNMDIGARTPDIENACANTKTKECDTAKRHIRVVFIIDPSK